MKNAATTSAGNGDDIERDEGHPDQFEQRRPDSNGFAD
jgi:hypothetical protein